jgi:hypothetical protein
MTDVGGVEKISGYCIQCGAFCQPKEISGNEFFLLVMPASTIAKPCKAIDLSENNYERETK